MMPRAPSEHSIDARDVRRIGIVADSHGPVDARLVAALARCELIIHAGDLVDSGALSPFAGRALGVLGNNDVSPALTRGRERLPEVLSIETALGIIAVIHGHQYPQAARRHAALRARFAHAAIVVYGHSHHLQIDRTASPWILNPGASGRARTFGGPSALRLTRVAQHWRVQTIRYGLLKK